MCTDNNSDAGWFQTERHPQTGDLMIKAVMNFYRTQIVQFETAVTEERNSNPRNVLQPKNQLRCLHSSLFFYVGMFLSRAVP